MLNFNQIKAQLFKYKFKSIFHSRIYKSFFFYKITPFLSFEGKKKQGQTDLFFSGIPTCIAYYLGGVKQAIIGGIVLF